MADSSQAEQLVQVIIKNLPAPVPGRRPVHTIGMGVKAEFVASDVARAYCIAEHFQGHPIPATVRFSNGLGGPDQHDGWSDVRGMATKFHLADGKVADLIATTLGEFFVRNPKEFFDFAAQVKLKPYPKQSPWRKILDMVQLRMSPRDPYPNETQNVNSDALVYANHNRFAQLGVVQEGAIGAPESYARASYHAVHTFFVIAPNGVRRPVRFSWQPVAGVRNTDTAAVPRDKYLYQELEERLKRWPARFLLMMTIGETGDDLDDPTRPWPSRRDRIVMGTLTLLRVSENQIEDGERISFNPWHLPPGIEPSNDPILAARRGAYEFSHGMREKCPFAGSQTDAK